MNFAAFYDSLTENVNYPLRAARLHYLIQKYSRTETSGKLLLDLACGSGSMSEEMAKLGYDVIGVDNSPAMLSAAMDKKFESGLPIQYLCQDIREIDMFGTMDAVICTLDSLNHLPSLEDIRKVFERVSLFAQPGGVFLFDMNTIYKHETILCNETFVYDTDEVFCVWENHPGEAPYSVDMQLTFFERDGEVYRRSEEVITERAYSPEEIEDMLVQSGLKVLAVYDADAELTHPASLQFCDASTERMLFVAYKPL